MATSYEADAYCPKDPPCQMWIHYDLMYQSIPSLTIPPGEPRRFAHSCCPWGRVFPPLSCPGIGPGYNFEKGAIFALSLKQMSSSSFHMFIYARSEQYDLIGGPTYLLIISWRTGYCYLTLIYMGYFDYLFYTGGCSRSNSGI